MTVTVLHGDCLEVLRAMPDAHVQCCVTSPPYWGLRDYGTAQWVGGDEGCNHTRQLGGIKRSTLHHYNNGLNAETIAERVNGYGRASYRETCGKCGATRIDRQLGLESAPDQYVANMVEVFREVRRVLRDDGTLWLNLADSYVGGGRGGGAENCKQRTNAGSLDAAPNVRVPGLKPKDLCMIPARVALALQEDGWWLRSDIIWSKPNPMPESVTDRPTKSHEYIFLLTKSEHYFYDADAIAEPVGEAFATDSRHQTGATARNDKQGYEAAGAQNPKGPHRAFGKWSGRHDNASGRRMTDNVARARGNGGSHDAPFGMTRNKRSVWTVTTKPFPGAHFATFPPDLIEPCIKAGSAIDGTVLDPFGGAGTTGLVADRLQRHAILIELNPDYALMARNRIAADAPLFAGAS